MCLIKETNEIKVYDSLFNEFELLDEEEKVNSTLEQCMEKLKIKQVEEEYYKVSDPHKKKNEKSDDSVPLLHDVLVDEGDKTTTPQTIQN